MKGHSILSLVIFSILLFACAPQQATQPTQQPPAPQQPSQEITIGVNVLSAPTSVQEGEKFKISWRAIAKEGTVISHTAVHYDNVSHPGSLGFDIAPPQAGYRELTLESALGEYILPSTFSSEITAGKTKIYYRAHAIINGENYWTQEYTIDVVKAASAMQANNYVVDADDKRASPASLSVPKGSKFTITFNVGTDVYYGGLDFRSSKFTSPKISPRGTWTTPELTADETFKISAYWPASNVKKWDLTVNVS